MQNERVIEAGRQPGILVRMLGSMLLTAREVAGLSYDEAAARLGCEADWLVRVETGFAVASPEEVARILVEYGVREASACRHDDRPGLVLWRLLPAVARPACAPDERGRAGTCS